MCPPQYSHQRGTRTRTSAEPGAQRLGQAVRHLHLHLEVLAVHETDSSRLQSHHNRLPSQTVQCHVPIATDLRFSPFQPSVFSGQSLNTSKLPYRHHTTRISSPTREPVNKGRHRLVLHTLLENLEAKTPTATGLWTRLLVCTTPHLVSR